MGERPCIVANCVSGQAPPADIGDSRTGARERAAFGEGAVIISMLWRLSEKAHDINVLAVVAQSIDHGGPPLVFTGLWYTGVADSPFGGYPPSR
jgi:hypothetical protein